jgi:hypothetical protein
MNLKKSMGASLKKGKVEYGLLMVPVLSEDPTEMIRSTVARYHNVVMTKQHIATLTLQNRRG